MSPLPRENCHRKAGLPWDGPDNCRGRADSPFLEPVPCRISHALSSCRPMKRDTPRRDLQGGCSKAIEFGKTRGVPWGVSESGHNTIDGHLNYQYGPFGRARPGAQTRSRRRSGHCSLCLGAGTHGCAGKGLPQSRDLAAQGIEGQYGFYEAIDYTPDASAFPRGESRRWFGPSWPIIRA